MLLALVWRPSSLIAALDHTVPYGTVLSGTLSRHFVPGYDRVVPPGRKIHGGAERGRVYTKCTKCIDATPFIAVGAEVKAGAVLAGIDTPEVDAQLAQAQAQLKVAQATRDPSKVTYQRFRDLFARKVIAAQDFDTAADNYGQIKVP